MATNEKATDPTTGHTPGPWQVGFASRTRNLAPATAYSVVVFRGDAEHSAGTMVGSAFGATPEEAMERGKAFAAAPTLKAERDAAQRMVAETFETIIRLKRERDALKHALAWAIDYTRLPDRGTDVADSPAEFDRKRCDARALLARLDGTK